MDQTSAVRDMAALARELRGTLGEISVATSTPIQPPGVLDELRAALAARRVVGRSGAA